MEAKEKEVKVENRAKDKIFVNITGNLLTKHHLDALLYDVFGFEYKDLNTEAFLGKHTIKFNTLEEVNLSMAIFGLNTGHRKSSIPYRHYVRTLAKAIIEALTMEYNSLRENGVLTENAKIYVELSNSNTSLAWELARIIYKEPYYIYSHLVFMVSTYDNGKFTGYDVLFKP